MTAKRKTWKEKLQTNNGLPRTEKIPLSMQKKFGKGTMVIPSPKEVDSIMKRVTKGKIITINKIREKIAKKHKASISCPITTGIFSWIAAHAAADNILAGIKEVTPYWRTLKEGGVINEKYPGGIEKQAILLEEEGHHLIKKGEKWVVEDWKNKLVK